MPGNPELTQSSGLLPIRDIAERIGIQHHEIEPYGHYKAKVSLPILERLNDKPRGKYIVVTAITPTPLGEGKTITTIGLSMGLNTIGKTAIACVRQPSLGPVFGIKGGAAGGGRSQILPMEEINLHLTGDMHAVAAAHNLGAAFLDNYIFKHNDLGIDPASITWPRVVDINDRFLRDIIIGLGGPENGFLRQTRFDITSASELMAILALADGFADLRERLSKIIMAATYDGRPVTPEDIQVAGAMAVLLREALKPNLLQTCEGTACFVHTGPFANIAHGNSSILADRIALQLADYVVTESGFGADMGAEKFFNIKCRTSGLVPDCAVLVCSVRALKMHSGRFCVVAGRPLEESLREENQDAVAAGCVNLQKQIENVLLFGVPVVVAINRFERDTDAEIEIIKRKAVECGAQDAVVSLAHGQGGRGTAALASAVTRACEQPHTFRLLYPLDMPIEEKIRTIACTIYGAGDVKFHPLAEHKIKQYTDWGFGSLPICMAKTHLSLSHEPERKGRPSDFTLPVRDVRIAAGAGFIYPLCGKMQTMPGLPGQPSGTRFDIDENGRINGLF